MKEVTSPCIAMKLLLRKFMQLLRAANKDIQFDRSSPSTTDRPTSSLNSYRNS